MTKEAEIEKAARQLCKEMGHDPDMIICMGMPQFFNNGIQFGYVMPRGYEQIPIWVTFRQFIIAAIRIVEEETKNA